MECNCDNAKKMFRKGDLVTLSVYGCIHLTDHIMNKSKGIVVGFGRGSSLIRILVRGLKNPVTYYMGFWERI